MTMTGYAYTAVSDFFQPTTWEADLAASFGLTTPHTWTTFTQAIDELTAACTAGERIVVLYAARHGQGEHNAMADRYPELGESVQVVHPIPDAPLTPLGRAQAAQVGAALAREARAGMPRPDKWYASPLLRAVETCMIEWAWAFPVDDGAEGTGPATGPPAKVLEDLREHLHVHACDRRSAASASAARFPAADWSGLAEHDALWRPGSVRGREGEREMAARLARAMAAILDDAPGARYVSVTAHSGALRTLYAVLGVRARALAVGELNVVVVRAKRHA